MNAKVEVKELIIGEGIPKICVPIIAVTRGEIKASAIEVKKHPFDLVEWRADFFTELEDPQAVLETLQMLREVLGQVPILFTLRTKEEGGEQRIDVEDYLSINQQAIKTGLIDLIDVEIFRGDDIAFLLIEAAHEAGVKVIASNHNFEKTPKKEEIIMRLCKMQELEADIAKIAVMPKSERDVLTLLDATLAMKELHKNTPVVTMAMGKGGLLSRISGQFFGSAITFGCVGSASAPGQIPVEELKELLNVFV